MSKAAELAKMGEVLTNGQIGGRRNMVINGAMQIAQRGTSGFTTNAAYTLDRYKVFCPAASFTLSQSTTAPTDFYHSLKIENTSAATPSSGQGGNIFTTLEGNSVSQLNWGTSNAKTATLSFYVRANNTGTYCINLENANGTIGTGSHSFVAEYTINSADTWEEKKIVIPGPTVGTWTTDTSLGIVIGWTLEVGSNFETSTTDAWQSGLKRQTSNQVNWQQTASANFHLTGVQFEIGKATPFEHRSVGEELELCHRYFEKRNVDTANYELLADSGVWTSTTAWQCPVRFKKVMRTAPTITNGGTLQVALRNSPQNITAFNVADNHHGRSALLYGTTATVSVSAGESARLQSNSLNAYIQFDAEL
tara:strand:- start:170 stop:1261 length:1092 start_codon:yes stop_codon:yes gene_type:complete